MYCIRIRTRRGIYSEICPEPKGVRFFRIYVDNQEAIPRLLMAPKKVQEQEVLPGAMTSKTQPSHKSLL